MQGQYSRTSEPLPSIAEVRKILDEPDREWRDEAIGKTWRRRLFGTNFCRVFIVNGRLIAIRT